jgi:5-bromo-4-chloroindolyl phosphate hydrolysis protein
MTIIINIIKTIISIPVFISAYIFFCLIIMGKIILKINRSIVNLLNNYLKNKGIND